MRIDYKKMGKEAGKMLIDLLDNDDDSDADEPVSLSFSYKFELRQST
ncbi:LacI-family transcriptional regulator [Yersinia enterocolitica]|nr:LacI-family transcriptional regulator [Yersinia enterocolitica]